ncbi:MAG TPA: hypothetical protein VFI13_11290 [Gemmatimonadales bacterium]|nr:hypothetical protein [Gemmatimonadales bacterium]
MTGAERLRRSLLLILSVGLLVAGGAPIGRAPESGQGPVRSSTAFEAAGAFGLAPGTAPDTRVQRDLDPRAGQRTGTPVGLGGLAAAPAIASPRAAAVEATLERAAHPERSGQILLRGPPGPSA